VTTYCSCVTSLRSLVFHWCVTRAMLWCQSVNVQLLLCEVSMIRTYIICFHCVTVYELLGLNISVAKPFECHIDYFVHFVIALACQVVWHMSSACFTFNISELNLIIFLLCFLSISLSLSCMILNTTIVCIISRHCFIYYIIIIIIIITIMVS